MLSVATLKRTFFLLLGLLSMMLVTIGFAKMQGRTVQHEMVRVEPTRIDSIQQDAEPKDHGPVPPFVIQGLSDSDLRGQARLVVLFASWCTPCMVEHPVIMGLAKKIPIYGIDVTDKPDGLEHYLKTGGNPYQKIGIDESGEVGLAWGANGLPTSFIVNPEGHIVWRHDGPMSADVAENIVLPIIQKLQK